ncbi:hypothetical protein AMECASPLE_033739 [Ameca splendens]|uniref:Uncharacterized protein n=1 Tax=Ameca splendens TaxID=208324 RepID=A0ABV0YI21_9TELE
MFYPHNRQLDAPFSQSLQALTCVPLPRSTRTLLSNTTLGLRSTHGPTLVRFCSFFFSVKPLPLNSKIKSFIPILSILSSQIAPLTSPPPAELKEHPRPGTF